MKLLQSAKKLAVRPSVLLTAFLCLGGSLIHAGAAPSEAEISKIRTEAEQGNATAQFKLGISYGNGEGVPKDLSLAVKWFRKAAEQGHANAQAALSRCYGEGWGIPKDDAEALKWLQKAAEQGHPLSQFNLAACYAEGKGGVAKDDVIAAKWLCKAAEQGLEIAQYAMGFNCYLGVGVQRNLVNSYKWLSLSKQAGCKEADEALQLVASKMTPEQIIEAKKLTADWKKKN